MYDELRELYLETNNEIESKSGLTELQMDNRIQLNAFLFNFIEMLQEPRTAYQRYFEANFDEDDPEESTVTFEQYLVEQKARLIDYINSDLGPM